MARFGMMAAIAALAVCAGTAEAREYFVGGPLHKYDMEIVANYLVGIEMAPMTAGMAHGLDVLHLEAEGGNPYFASAFSPFSGLTKVATG